MVISWSSSVGGGDGLVVPLNLLAKGAWPQKKPRNVVRFCRSGPPTNGMAKSNVHFVAMVKTQRSPAPPIALSTPHSTLVQIHGGECERKQVRNRKHIWTSKVAMYSGLR